MKSEMSVALYAKSAILVGRLRCVDRCRLMRKAAELAMLPGAAVVPADHHSLVSSCYLFRKFLTNVHLQNFSVNTVLDTQGLGTTPPSLQRLDQEQILASATMRPVPESLSVCSLH